MGCQGCPKRGPSGASSRYRLLSTVLVDAHSRSPDTLQAIKMLKRKDRKAEKMNALRKRNLPSSPHVPLVDKMSDTELKILKEIAIMKKLQHPHVVRLLEVMDDHLLKEIYLGKHHASPSVLAVGSLC